MYSVQTVNLNVLASTEVVILKPVHVIATKAIRGLVVQVFNIVDHFLDYYLIEINFKHVFLMIG